MRGLRFTRPANDEEAPGAELEELTAAVQGARVAHTTGQMRPDVGAYFGHVDDDVAAQPDSPTSITEVQGCVGEQGSASRT
jgi:hypothetical protein